MAMVRTPSSTPEPVEVSSVVSFWASVSAVVSSVLPQAARDRVMASAMSRDRNFFISITFPVEIFGAIHPAPEDKKWTALSSGPWERRNDAEIPTAIDSASQSFCDSPAGISRQPSIPKPGSFETLRRCPLSRPAAACPCWRVLMNLAPLSKRSKFDWYRITPVGGCQQENGIF